MTREEFTEWRALPATKKVFAALEAAKLRIADQALSTETDYNLRYALGFRDAVGLMSDPDELAVEVCDE